MAGIVYFVVAASLFDAAVGEEEAASTCYSSGDIAGSVLGTFFSTLAAVAIAFIIYWFVCRPKHGTSKKLRPSSVDVEAHAYDNPYFQEDEPDKVSPADIKAENGTANSGKSLADKNKQLSNDAKSGKKSKSTKNNPFSNVFSNNKTHTIQRALDDSCIQQEPEKLEVRLRGCDFTGLGFNICGNIRHGIYVRDVLHRGPASESGKIKAGDRILGVTVCFDKITIEDALTILSYASPYDVTLYIQKTSEQPGGFLPGHQKKGSTASSVSGSGVGGGGEPLSHPVYRSQSSDDVSQLTREAANNKRSMSVGVVPPRLKKETLNRLSPTCRVEAISEGGDVQIHNESNKRETVVTVVVNESPESRKEEGVKRFSSEVPSSTNPFTAKSGSKSETDDRRNSTQTSSAFVVPRNLMVEIPNFGLADVNSEDGNGVNGANGNIVLGPCVEPANVLAEEHSVAVHALDGNGIIGVPEMKRTFIRELTKSNDDILSGFTVPAMDLDDIHVTLEQVKDGEVSLSEIEQMSKESGVQPDVTAIKQTILDKLKQEVSLVTSPDEVKVNSESVQRVGGETVVLPRVDIKIPTVADFERNSPLDASLDENINYFESKMQTVLQKSPKMKPKRNSNAGKRRAPLPPNSSQPSSPSEDDSSFSGNPFVIGIPSQASVAEPKTTSVVFLQANNVTSVQVNDSSSSPEPKSPRKIRSDGVDFRKTNFYEGLDKADGEEKFNSIPRSGLCMPDKKTTSNDKVASARRAASLDDLTKIEEIKPLPLERAVSMDLNNVEDPPVDQLGDIDLELEKVSSDERLLLKYGYEDGRGYKKSWENLAQMQKEDDKQDLEQWIDENIDRKSPSKLQGFFKKDKGVKRKKKIGENSNQTENEMQDNSVDGFFVTRPLDRTLSLSSSSLSEDSIEITVRQPAAKRQMMKVETKMLAPADFDSDDDKSRNLSPSNVRVKSDISARRSPTVTIPIIPPIITARDLRTPSPSKEFRDHGGLIDAGGFRSPTSKQNPRSILEQKENGEHNGTSTNYRYSVNNNDHDVNVTTTHVTLSDDQGKNNVETYSVSSQGVVSKTVFISGPQLAMPVVDTTSDRPGPESPPPILQPPE